MFGKVYAPVGAQLVLQNNGTDDLPVTVQPFPQGTDKYNTQDFSLIAKLPDGAAYQVSVKTPPAGQSCSVYKGASGTMPVAAGALRVGCEHDFDLVSRSTDDTVRGTYFDSSAPVVGGSSQPIGTTLDGYGEGRYVAFVSSAAGVGGGVSNAHRQVYWRDRSSGKTLLVSASASGVEGNDNSFAPAISADGLTVAFESYASNLVASDGNGVRDVFVWQVNEGAVAKRVSVGPGGIESNGASFDPTLSGDGRVVAFSTAATNLATGAWPVSGINVVRRDLAAGTNLLVSDASDGFGGSKPALSEDGSRLAFQSISSTLVAGDTNGLWDIFVHDMASGSLSRVSLTSTGAERDQGSDSASREVAPAISGNGRHVAFATTASNMVAGDTNGMQDVFVVDTQTGAVVRASVGSNGAQGNADSPLGQGERVALSYDGTWVAFSTVATNLGFDPGTTGIGNIVMHNTVTGETRAVTNQTVSSAGPAVMSRDAAYVVFGAGTPLDGRFSSTGLFARFTGLARAFFWWVD